MVSDQELSKVRNKFSMKVELKGRKSGITRIANLFFVLLDGKVYARSRFDKNWIRNVRVNPDVRVRISDHTFQAKAIEVDDSSLNEPLRKAFRAKYKFFDYFVLWFLIRGKARFVAFERG